MLRLFFILWVLTGFCLAQQATPASATPTPAGTSASLERLVASAMKMPAWRSARHQVERLTILRDKALAQKDQTDPVSDRYVITILGGPVDMVRFLGLARIVCAGKDRRASLMKEFQREKREVTPDDLPSNALGALFGEELRPHMRDTEHDLVPDLRRFFASLEPADDAAIQRHTYQRLVHGIKAESTQQERATSRDWRTAEPLYLISLLAPDRASKIPNAEAALHAAGLETRRAQGLPIVIERIGTPDPQPPPPRAVPVPEDRPAHLPLKPQPQRPSRAVPVPE
jgi:hypothetical protein